MPCMLNRQQMTDLVRTSIDAIVVLDTEGDVVFANPAAEALLGKPPGGATGYHLGCPVADGQPFEITFRRKVSDTAIVEMQAVETVWEGKRVFVVNLHDITERRHAEQRLAESEQRYRSLFETMSHGVVYRNADGEISAANPAAQRMLGLTLEHGQALTVQDPHWRCIREDGSDFPIEAHPTMVALQTGERVDDVVMGVCNPVDDTCRWLNVVAVPRFRSGEDRPFQVYAIFKDITLRKQAVDQAQLLAAIVQSTEDAVVSKTLDGVITSWNHGAERMYGYRAEEAIGQNIAMLVSPGMENDLPTILERIRAGEKVKAYETVRTTKQGRRIYVSLTVSPVNNEAGRTIGASSITKDVTASRKTRLELEQALARVDHLNHMLHTIRRINLLIGRERQPDVLIRNACDIIVAGQGVEAVWIVLQDEGGGVRCASQAGIDDHAVTELLTGFKTGRLPPCCRRLSKRQQSTSTVDREAICALCPLGKPHPAAAAFTSRLQYEGNHFGYLNAYLPAHFGDDREVRELTKEIAEDLSFALQGLENEQARREAENQLRKNEQLLNETGEMAKVGGWEIDLGAELVAWTQSTRKIHEVPDDYEPTLEEALKFFVPEARDQLTEAIRRAREEEVPFDLELAFITAKGNRLWTRAICQPEFQDGTCVRLHGTFQDITELKNALDERLAIHEQFQQVQKLESIGLLAGGVAHDFNNMLSVILGYGAELLDKLHKGDPLREGVEEIVSAGQRSADLTRQLLAFSRKQTLQVEVLDINAVVSNLEKMLRRLIGEDIGLKTLFSEQLNRVKVDPGQIEQVILNLAVNARDAMPQGGNLTIETANVELDGDYAQNRTGVVPGQYVQLSITDTGCGMDAATRERLFEPFFTTKGKGRGTGLGLSTVYGIVKQSGGNIWVYSVPGQGTTFKIYLPRTVDAQIAREATHTEASIKGRAEKILVIEDEPALRKLCATILKRANYQVTVAANGGEALLLVEENKLRPDLVITDMVMPGMSGKVLVGRLRKRLPDLKVLYMSGYTDNAIVHHGGLDAGTPFIQKPFEKGKLERKTRELLNGQ